MNNHTIANSERFADMMGKRLADVLNIKADYNGFINTQVGPKDYKGLARLIDDIIKANETKNFVGQCNNL